MVEGQEFYPLELSTTGVLAPAPYFRNVRLLSLPTIFATVLAPFFRGAAAGRVRTCGFALFFCHVGTSFTGTGGSPLLVYKLMLGRLTNPVKRALQFCRVFKARREQQSVAVCFPLSQPKDG